MAHFDAHIRRRRAVKRITAYVPALIWAALVIFIGGRSNVPTVESSLPLDKIAHFFMYGALGALATRGWLKAQRPRRLVIVLVLAMAVGVADEIHQRWVPHRTSDVKDWIADAVGITVAATLVLKHSRGRSRDAV